jgi:Tol biopolymer transport system component
MPCRGALTTLAAVGAVAAVTASAPASPTSTRPELGLPYWVAGGRLIAFAADERPSLWMMRADGKQRKRLAAEYLYASLSPSGRMVADFPGAGNDLVLRTVAGKGIRTFHLGPGPGDLLGGAPVWSPDESSLVFEIERETATNTFDLIFLADRRTGLHLLSRVRQPADFAPAWSPDGRRIAFVRCPNSDGDSPCKLTVMRRDGSGRTVIAPSVHDLAAPVWSPDGRSLAFEQQFGPAENTPEDLFKVRHGIYLLRLGGSGLRRVAATRMAVVGFSRPAWSPDGHRLAFSDARGISVLDLRSGGPRRITSKGGGSTVSWARVGGILFAHAGAIYRVTPGKRPVRIAQ